MESAEKHHHIGLVEDKEHTVDVAFPHYAQLIESVSNVFHKLGGQTVLGCQQRNDIINFAAALSGRVLCLRLTPRALPWAISCWPCRPFANTGL